MKCFHVLERAINFPVPLKDTKTEIGFFVTLEAEHDHPRAEAYWTKDGFEIEKGDKYEFVQNELKHKLIINDVVPEDIAKYALVVGRNKAETSCKLSVESKL